MAERWKDIRGFPGYQVSDKGRVRTHNKVTHTQRHGDRHWKDRIMKQKGGKKFGYRVSLWKDGKPYYVLVHRLVADAFISPLMFTDLTVNHKDGDRLNNCANNLEWMPRVDNIRYGFENGQYPAAKGCALITEYGDRVTYRSMCDASISIGRSAGYVAYKYRCGRKAIGKNGTIYTIEEL